MPNYCAKFYTNATEAEKIFNDLDQIDDNTNFTFSIFQTKEEDNWCVELLFLEFDKTFNYSLANSLIQGKANLENFQIEELPDEDWIAKSLESLKPIRVGQLFIHWFS